MRLQQRNHPRRGAIIPFVAVCLIALLGMVALAIDIGMVAVAKAQAQNAADSAAVATVRTFTGQTGYNLANAPKAGFQAAAANQILASAVNTNASSIAMPKTDVYTSGNVTLACGAYYYIYNDASPSSEAFQITIPNAGTGLPTKPASQPYTAVTSTVTGTNPVFFGSVFGASPFNVTASATAAFRPRDVVLIMDLSGSMRFESMMAMASAGGGTVTEAGARTISMNPDPNYPIFGHYSNTASAALQGTTTYPTADVMCPPGNMAYAAFGGSAIVADYTWDGTNPAFTAAPTSYATTPGGDNYLQSGGSYVQTTSALLGFSSPSTAAQYTAAVKWCQSGYQGQTGTAFNGYTQGPSFWGKTFFVWPPDPRGSDKDPTSAANHANNGALDWRQRFFFKVNSSTGQLYWLDQNTVLFNPNGAPNSTANPIINKFGSTGKITQVTENGATVNYYCLPNYAAIFQWLKNQSATNPTTIFPASLLSGRIQFYSKIPDPTGDLAFNSRFWTSHPMADLSERFWKDYVDFMLGQIETGAGKYANTGGILSTAPFSSMIGTGDLYSWGSVAITQKPDATVSNTATVSAAAAAGATTVTINGVSGAGLTNGSTYYLRFGYTPSSGSTYYGSWFYQFTAPASGTGPFVITINTANITGLQQAVANGAPVKIYSQANLPQYMSYTDNPYRPKHQFWFGGQTWVDWLGNYSTYVYSSYAAGGTYTLRWAGNTHESQSWSCKVGLSAAITDFQTNHPADYVGLTFFSTPYDPNETALPGFYNGPVVSLGQNYTQMQQALWFPPTTVTGSATSVTPYDTDFFNVPRAQGGTAPGMGFMIAYNMLSSSVTNLRTYSLPQPTYRGLAGGMGRKGAQRLVIFETDGAPNNPALASLVSSGSDSYYPIRLQDPTNIPNTVNEFPSVTTGYNAPDVFYVVQQICASTTASPPGYSTTRKPAYVYALGYGSLFDPANSSLPGQGPALTFLQSVQYYGGTSSDKTGANFPSTQLIYGASGTRPAALQTAISNIVKNTVSISLLQ